MNIHNQIRTHRALIECLYTIRELEERRIRQEEVIASCDQMWGKYHPYASAMMKSYQGALNSIQTGIDDEWREYHHLMGTLSSNPIRIVIQKIKTFIGEAPRSNHAKTITA